MIQQPVQGHADHRTPFVSRYLLELLNRGEVLRMPIAPLVERIGIKTRARRNILEVMLPGQQPGRQRIVGDDLDAEFLGHENEFLLDSPGNQAVHGLRGARHCVFLFLGDREHLRNLPGGVI